MTRHRLTTSIVSVVLAASLGTACGPTQRGGPPLTLTPGGVAIVADNLAFDTKRLEVRAGVGFGLRFENHEGAPHNVRIYDEGGANPLFVGEIFSGPATRLYQVPSLAPGTHRFRCDVHPAMTGDVIAR
jgi:plastocyanin